MTGHSKYCDFVYRAGDCDCGGLPDQFVADALTQSIVPELVARVQWAGRQIDAALADSRVGVAAAAWLRTIKDDLFNASGDVTPEPTEETP